MTVTDTETSTASAAPAKKGGPKMCETCGKHRAIGGDKSLLGKMVALCLGCIQAAFEAGKCPKCGLGLKTKTHQSTCIETG